MSIAWAFVIAWALYGLLGPVKLRGERNQHSALFVRLRKDTPGQHQPSIEVQEVGEWRLHKLIGVTVGAVCAAFVVPALPLEIAPMGALIPMMFADSLTRKVRQIDWAGHGAEVLNAEAEGIAGYREAEAQRVAWGYGVDRATALKWFLRYEWLSRAIYWLARW